MLREKADVRLLQTRRHVPDIGSVGNKPGVEDGRPTLADEEDLMICCGFCMTGGVGPIMGCAGESGTPS